MSAGPLISQVCATSARCLADAAQEVDTGSASLAFVVTADRTSNGPQVYYPNPLGPGGSGSFENVVLDNMQDDPTIHIAMVDTAENVAREWQITTEEQHEVALRRYEQYNDALANDSAFLKRFMILPFEVPDAKFRKTVATLERRRRRAPDEPRQARQAQARARGRHRHLRRPDPPGRRQLRDVRDDAREGARIRRPIPRSASRSSASAWRASGRAICRRRRSMPRARRSSARGSQMDDIDAIKSHNPFAVNDIVFARETGVDVMKMNNYGCSLVWGHPQGPTGLRAMIELIEELVMRGGGKGLFKGCAAGDTGMAVVLSVEDA